jgi:hypothetical protein
VQGFVNAVSHPLVTSDLTQLGSVMPFGTDMTVFVDNGVAAIKISVKWIEAKTRWLSRSPMCCRVTQPRRPSPAPRSQRALAGHAGNWASKTRAIAAQQYDWTGRGPCSRAQPAGDSPSAERQNHRAIRFGL